MTSAVLKRHIRERWTGHRAALFTKLALKLKWAVVVSIPSRFVKIPLMWPETRPQIYDTRIGRKSREIRVRAHYLIGLLSARLIQCMQRLSCSVLHKLLKKILFYYKCKNHTFSIIHWIGKETYMLVIHQSTLYKNVSFFYKIRCI